MTGTQWNGYQPTGRPPGRPPKPTKASAYKPVELPVGWVVRCPDHVSEPMLDFDQAWDTWELWQTNGCPHQHHIIDVWVYADGVHFRYIDREDIAS